MQTHIRLHAVDLRDARVESASVEEQPLARAGADVEDGAGGVVLDQGSDFGGGVFGRARAEPGPEAREPDFFEEGDVGEGLQVQGCEEVEDGGGDVGGGVVEEEEGAEEVEGTGLFDWWWRGCHGWGIEIGD